LPRLARLLALLESAEPDSFATVGGDVVAIFAGAPPPIAWRQPSTWWRLALELDPGGAGPYR
jgi:hypothetical protein